MEIKEPRQRDIDTKWDKAWQDEDKALKNFFAHRVFIESYPVYKKFFVDINKGRMLEVGTGSGRYGLKLASDYPHLEVVMTDILETSVGIVTKRIADLQLVNARAEVADAKNLPFANETFDVVFCDAVIQYFPDYTKAVAEMERVLKPGGKLILSVVNWWNLAHTIEKKIVGDKFVWGFERSFTRKELRNVVGQFNLRVVAEDGFAPAYGVYRLKYRRQIFKLLGRILGRLVKIVDPITGRVISRYLGFQIIVVAEKPHSREAQSEPKEQSAIRKLARWAVIKIDPLVKRRLTRYLASRKPQKEPEQFSEEEMTLVRGRIKALADLPVPSNRELKRVEIIVLKYKDPEIETICASRIIENTEWPYKLNFFDNRPGTKNMSKIWNQLIRESTCDHVLIIDSDAFVPRLNPCWLTRMMNMFEKVENCWVILPKVTRTSCNQQRASKAVSATPELLAEPFAAQCALYKKEIFDRIGYFDEDFLMYGQDTEWAHRLLTSAHKAYILPDVLVEHLGHYSNKKAAKRGEYDKKAENEYANKVLQEKISKKN